MGHMDGDPITQVMSGLKDFHPAIWQSYLKSSLFFFKEEVTE
jgi:hypothetical protein